MSAHYCELKLQSLYESAAFLLKLGTVRSTPYLILHELQKCGTTHRQLKRDHCGQGILPRLRRSWHKALEDQDRTLGALTPDLYLLLFMRHINVDYLLTKVTQQAVQSSAIYLKIELYLHCAKKQ